MRDTARRLAIIAATLACTSFGVSSPARAQAATALAHPIPFHGAKLVSFDRGVALKTETRIVRPSEPGRVFVTLSLELSGPFEYVQGRFREITLVDERDTVYRYRGWLTEEGWVEIDNPDAPPDGLGTMEADEYPAYLDLHFEVPASAQTLVVHFGDQAETLFAKAPAR